jgi:hypothetical protein
MGSGKLHLELTVMVDGPRPNQKAGPTGHGRIVERRPSNISAVHWWWNSESGAIQKKDRYERAQPPGATQGDMAVTVEMHNIGDVPTSREIVALIEHVLSDRPGAWRVSIMGSRANDNWEMKVEGPKGFERSYALLGSADQHQPQAIANVLLKLLPGNTG